MVMGTASTMACLAEALGMALPNTAAIPTTHADRIRAAEDTGKQAVVLAKKGPRPTQIMTRAAFTNALTVLQAIGGSTNGLVHLTAVAGRCGVKPDLDAFHAIGQRVPVLLDLKPSGQHYMEHFHWAGGLPRLMREIAGDLDLSALTVMGGTLKDYLAVAEEVKGQTVIRPRAAPLKKTGAMATLWGNLAPRGAVIKQSAASPALMEHTGRAVVFDSVEDMTRRIDDPKLDVRPGDVLVLRNAGPKGAPGMPEAGYLPIPKKLLKQGVKDMVRISDARMSGTAFGTIVLHIAPEAAVGGPLALVKSGDKIRLDVKARRIELLVGEAELKRRRKALKPRKPPKGSERGYAGLFQRSVLQADEGCDFDFCVPGRAAAD
jgi:dihydroxy-acid dehydratase